MTSPFPPPPSLPEVSSEKPRILFSFGMGSPLLLFLLFRHPGRKRKTPDQIFFPFPFPLIFFAFFFSRRDTERTQCSFPSSLFSPPCFPPLRGPARRADRPSPSPFLFFSVLFPFFRLVQFKGMPLSLFSIFWSPFFS